jgi:hypothetical protein
MAHLHDAGVTNARSGPAEQYRRGGHAVYLVLSDGTEKKPVDGGWRAKTWGAT